MIRRMRVKNIGLMEELDLEFEEGLTVITGETGAGKTMILKAIEWLFMGKMSKEVLRLGTKEGSIEIIFDIEGVVELKKKMDWMGLGEEDELIIRKEIREDGRSRAMMNGMSVVQSQLREWKNDLIDVTSQNDHQILFREKMHLEILDHFGGLEEERWELRELVEGLEGLKESLRGLLEWEEAREKRNKMEEYAKEEIGSAKLRIEEEVELEKELRILEGYEELEEGLRAIYHELYIEESGVMLGLEKVLVILERLKGGYEDLRGVYDRLKEASYILENEKDEVRDFRGKVEYNESRVEELNERLMLIKDLKRKYGFEVEGLLRYEKECEGRVREYESAGDRRKDLEKKIKEKEEAIEDRAIKLSKRRQEYGNRLEGLIMEELRFLGINQGIFRIGFKYIEDEGSFIRISGKGIKVYKEGLDKVEFIFSGNMGEKPKPLMKIASGGELSRVMLAMKGVLSRYDPCGTLIFDELEVGIGGETVMKVGERMRRLSRKKQIICITHSAQIASGGRNHYQVRKEEEKRRTKILIKRLESKEDRIKEIGRMLSGDRQTETSLNHARELMDRI